MPNTILQGIYGPIITALESCNYIIAMTENKLLLIPCDKFNNKALINKKAEIPLSEINIINIEKGNFGFIKIKIKNETDTLFDIQFGYVDLKNALFKDNVSRFINSFNNTGKELLFKVETKSSNKKGLYILMLFFIATSIILFIGNDISTSIIMLFMAIFTYVTMIKKKK